MARDRRQNDARCDVGHLRNLSVRQIMAAMRVDRAIAPVLALWLSGVCCLLLCASVCADRAPASAEHGCCARSAEIEAEESCGAGAAIGVEGSGAGGTCCFLSSRHATSAPLPDGFGTPAAPPVSSTVPAAVAAAPDARVAVVTLPVQNRGDTYLRCCVFLI